jgi:transcriptional regulator with GAF, ATPase, and Fis domain
MTNTDNDPDPDTLRKREMEHRRIIAITNALISEVEPAPLFAAVAMQLRTLYPVTSIGIAYYDDSSDTFVRGMLMTSDGVLQSIEPIPHRGTLLEQACAGDGAFIVAGDRVDSALRRFVSLGETKDCADQTGVLLPLRGRTRRLLGVAAALCLPERPFTEDDLPFLNQLAIQVGLAVENVQLHQENRLLRQQLEREGKYLRDEIEENANVDGLLYASNAIARSMHQVEKAAATDATVLLTGETGTGKELFARTIHAKSGRAARPLLKVNCGAISAGLIESTLFGHEKGAFTGAVHQHIGLFEVADRGTLFLDEIAELPLELQVKLLRVLQEGEITRVGGTTPIRVDVRIIAATNREIDRMVRDGAFREDLFYRLNVIPVVIPPLRDRIDDIPLLATYFVQKYSRRFKKPIMTIEPDAMMSLRKYAFPGNVRELEHMIERAVVLCDGRSLTPAALPIPGVVQNPGIAAAPDERESIIAALRASNWIIEGERGAARKLHLKPSTLRSKLVRLGIKRTDH